jgi:hypothetical protein
VFAALICESSARASSSARAAAVGLAVPLFDALEDRPAFFSDHLETPFPAEISARMTPRFNLLRRN